MLFLLALVACPDDGEGVNCDTMAAYSTSVTVTDADGSALVDATVTYAVDGEELGACEAMPDGTWACGVERAGHFVITAEAEGYEVGTVEVDVEQGECHVEAQAVSVELAPEESVCGGALANSIQVELIDAAGGELTGEAVAYRSAEVDDAPWVACDDEGAYWMCGQNETGIFDVQADADGHQTAWALVTVYAGDDGCDDAITEQIEITLEESVE